MVDLSTKYLGLKLKNPIVVSSSPLTAELGTLQDLEDAGAAAVVLPSLFEEQVELQNIGHRRLLLADQEPLPENLQFIPDMEGYNQGVDGYLSLAYRAKRALDIPVIGSLNGYYGGGWVQHARLLEAVGLDALELNVYYLATRPDVDGSEVERMYLDLVQDVKANVRIPVAVKVSPYFSALAHIARQLERAGADALVLFNRFYQPDFDLNTQTIVPSLDLSDPAELRLRLRWVAILANQIETDLAVTGGVHSAEDVLKSLMAGAKVAMMTSALLEHGINHLDGVLSGIRQWMEEQEYRSLAEIIGRMSQGAVADPAALERANYMEVLKSGDF
jgi:dihydroorotate dehydrogenase (fumarate)